MKTYLKILGILSLLTILAIIVGLSVIVLDREGGERLIAISLFVPVYFIFHFLIANRCGFNYRQEQSKPLGTFFLILSIASLLILIFVPLRFAFQHLKRTNQFEQLKEETSQVKDWGIDTTAYSYFGKLMTKYFDGDVMYQLNIRSEKHFNTELTGFTIELLDSDGFKIDEISINDYSRSVDVEGKIIGISANSNSYMPIEDYARIGSWKLLVKTKN